MDNVSFLTKKLLEKKTLLHLTFDVKDICFLSRLIPFNMCSFSCTTLSFSALQSIHANRNWQDSINIFFLMLTLNW